MPDDGISAPNMDNHEKLSTADLVRELQDLAELKNQELKFGLMEDLAEAIGTGNIEIDRATRKEVRKAIDKVLGAIDESKLTEERKASISKLRDSIKDLTESVITPEHLTEQLGLLIKSAPRMVAPKTKRILEYLKGKQVLVEKDDRNLRRIEVLVQNLDERYDNNPEVKELCKRVKEMVLKTKGLEITDDQLVDKIDTVRKTSELKDPNEAVRQMHTQTKELNDEINAKPDTFGTIFNWGHMQQLEELLILAEVKFSFATELQNDLKALIATALAAKGFSVEKKVEPKKAPPKPSIDKKEPKKQIETVDERVKRLLTDKESESGKKTIDALNSIGEKVRLLRKAQNDKVTIKIPGTLLASAGYKAIKPDQEYEVDAEQLLKHIKVDKILGSALSTAKKEKNLAEEARALVTALLKEKLIKRKSRGWKDKDLTLDQQKIVNAEKEFALNLAKEVHRQQLNKSAAFNPPKDQGDKPAAHSSPVPDIDDALAMASHHPDVQDAKNARYRAQKSASTKASRPTKPAPDPVDHAPTGPAAPTASPTDNTVIKSKGPGEDQKTLNEIEANPEHMEKLDKLEVLRRGFSDEAEEKYRKSGIVPTGLKDDLEAYLKAKQKLKTKTDDPLNLGSRKEMALALAKEAKAANADEWQNALDRLIRTKLAIYSRKFLI